MESFFQNGARVFGYSVLQIEPVLESHKQSGIKCYFLLLRKLAPIANLAAQVRY